MTRNGNTPAGSEKFASRNGRDGHTLARLMDEKRRLEIGMRLKQYREAAAMTQPQAAERAGVGFRSYQAWEYGESATNLEQYEKLAEIFGVELRDIIGTESGEPPWVDEIRGQLSELQRSVEMLLEQRGIEGMERAVDELDPGQGEGRGRTPARERKTGTEQ